MEAVLNIDDKYMRNLRRKLNTDDDRALLQNALAALDWMADEQRMGRIVILSSTEDGQDRRRLSLPLLEAQK